LTLVSVRREDIADIPIVPAPVPPVQNDDAPPTYEFDSFIYLSARDHPESPVRLCASLQLPGVDAVTTGITPFQHNSVARDLTAYTALAVKPPRQHASAAVAKLPEAIQSGNPVAAGLTTVPLAGRPQWRSPSASPPAVGSPPGSGTSTTRTFGRGQSCHTCSASHLTDVG
jgi:hypothetical protein